MKQIFILGFVLFTTHFAQSQQYEELFNHRVAAKYYSRAELTAMRDNAPERLTYLYYYYLHSYSVTPYSCSTCQPFIPELVDINNYNIHRQKSQRVTITDTTYGFEITLYSYDDIGMMIRTGIPVAAAEQTARTANSNIPSDFPLYTDTGSLVTDLNNYIQAKEQWEQNNPARYREMLRNDSGIHFISADEFMNMPQQKQQVIIQNQGIYVIQND